MLVTYLVVLTLKQWTQISKLHQDKWQSVERQGERYTPSIHAVAYTCYMFDSKNPWILRVVFRHEEKWRKSCFHDLLIITKSNFYKLTFIVDFLPQSSSSHDWITVSCTSTSVIIFSFKFKESFFFYLFSASSFSLHPSQYLPMGLGYGGFT